MQFHFLMRKEKCASKLICLVLHIAIIFESSCVKDHMPKLVRERVTYAVCRSINIDEEEDGHTINPLAYSINEACFGEVARHNDASVLFNQIHHAGYWASRQHPRLPYSAGYVLDLQWTPGCSPKLIPVYFWNIIVWLEIE